MVSRKDHLIKVNNIDSALPSETRRNVTVTQSVDEWTVMANDEGFQTDSIQSVARAVQKTDSEQPQSTDDDEVRRATTPMQAANVQRA